MIKKHQVQSFLSLSIVYAPIFTRAIVSNTMAMTQTQVTMNPTTVSLLGFRISRSNIMIPPNVPLKWLGGYSDTTLIPASRSLCSCPTGVCNSR